VRYSQEFPQWSTPTSLIAYTQLFSCCMSFELKLLNLHLLPDYLCVATHLLCSHFLV
jgi:hypothetical protein